MSMSNTDWKLNEEIARNETEEIVWQSLDVVLEMLDEVALRGVLHAKSEDIAEYIQANVDTIKSRLKRGL